MTPLPPPFGFAVFLASGLFIAWLAVLARIMWTLTHPPRRGYSYALARNLPGDPQEAGYAFSDWTCTAGAPGRSVELPVWDIVGAAPRGPVIIVSHGWGDSRVVMLSHLPTLVRHASRVILYDARGHGDASGICTLGMREPDDLLALVACLRTRDESRTTPLMLYGFSLGAGSAIAAAARAPEVRGVIVEAPYRMPLTPARNVLRLRGLPSGFTLALTLKLLRVRFDRVEQLHAGPYHPPLLVLHGDADVISPIQDGEAIAAAGQGEFVRVPGGQHNALWTDPVSGALAGDATVTFLERCRQPGAM